jgi:hypothetical protein
MVFGGSAWTIRAAWTIPAGRTPGAVTLAPAGKWIHAGGGAACVK